MNIRATGIMTALLLITASMNTNAAEEKVSTKPTTANGAEAGMRVYVDPQTGELVSSPVTAEQRQQASAADAAFNQDNTDLVPVRMPDGSIMVDLQGRFQQATVATVQPDGSIRTYCNDADHVAQGVHNHDAIGTAPQTSPATSSSPEDR